MGLPVGTIGTGLPLGVSGSTELTVNLSLSPAAAALGLPSFVNHDTGTQGDEDQGRQRTGSDPYVKPRVSDTHIHAVRFHPEYFEGVVAGRILSPEDQARLLGPNWDPLVNHSSSRISTHREPLGPVMEANLSRLLARAQADPWSIEGRTLGLVARWGDQINGVYQQGTYPVDGEMRYSTLGDIKFLTVIKRFLEQGSLWHLALPDLDGWTTRAAGAMVKEAIINNAHHIAVDAVGRFSQEEWQQAVAQMRLPNNLAESYHLNLTTMPVPESPHGTIANRRFGLHPASPRTRGLLTLRAHVAQSNLVRRAIVSI